MAIAAKLKDVNIGQLIRAKVDELHIPYAEFARQINCARTSLYHIFNSKSIDLERLVVISEVLQFDFISEVYLKDLTRQSAESGGGACLVLPFKNGRINWADVPPEMVEMLRRELLSKL